MFTQWSLHTQVGRSSGALAVVAAAFAASVSVCVTALAALPASI